MKREDKSFPAPKIADTAEVAEIVKTNTALAAQREAEAKAAADERAANSKKFIDTIRRMDVAVAELAPVANDGVIFELISRLAIVRPELCGCLDAIALDSERPPYERTFANALRQFLVTKAHLSDTGLCIGCYPERCTTV